MTALAAKPTTQATGEFSSSVDACIEILRGVRRRRIRTVALMHALECEYSMDDWYGAVRTLRGAGELSREEAVFLIESFADNPGLGPLALDPELREAWETQRKAIIGSMEDYLAEKWRRARESLLRAAFFHAQGDADLAKLAEGHSDAWGATSLSGQEQYIEKRPLTESDYAADLLVDQQSPTVPPVGDGTPELEWCVREIRTLLAVGIRSESNFELGYPSAASGRAWFGALRALQDRGEIDDGRAVYLFERFASVASDSPSLELEEFHLETMEEEPRDESEAQPWDGLIDFCRRLGEDAMADMLASDPERFDRLWRRGKHELLRSTKRGGSSIGPGFRDRLR